MTKLVCKFCRKPLKSNQLMDKLVDIMGMPEDSGAHAACLGLEVKAEETGSSETQGEQLGSKRASPEALGDKNE